MNVTHLGHQLTSDLAELEVNFHDHRKPLSRQTTASTVLDDPTMRQNGQSGTDRSRVGAVGQHRKNIATTDARAQSSRYSCDAAQQPQPAIGQYRFDHSVAWWGHREPWTQWSGG